MNVLQICLRLISLYRLLLILNLWLSLQVFLSFLHFYRNFLPRLGVFCFRVVRFVPFRVFPAALNRVLPRAFVLRDVVHRVHSRVFRCLF